MSPTGRRRPADSPVPVAIAVLVGIAILGATVWLWLGAREQPPADPPVAGPPAPLPDAPPLSGSDLPPLELPELSASDALVRDMAARLSSNPQLARWLVTDDLVQRFVGVVVDLAGSSNPSEHVPFLIPQGDFAAVETGGRLVIAPESHRRFDLLSATFVSLDARGTARLYRQMRPLVDEAYGQLGIPFSFDETLALAIRNLLAVEVGEESPEVVGSDGVYVYADPAVEGRRGAEKALMRMGPVNARRIQGKVAEIAAELGIEP